MLQVRAKKARLRANDTTYANALVRHTRIIHTSNAGFVL